MDKKLYAMLDKIEQLAIEARGETTYSTNDLKICEKLEKIQSLSYDCLRLSENNN